MTQPPHSSVAKRRPRALFLHTGWRSAGTWIWSRFRAEPAVTGFYEPLSTLLGDLRPGDLAAVEPAWTSGHPELKTPYFEEYRPFMQARGPGVQGYRKRFSIDRFGTAPDAEFPALQAYLAGLVAPALEAGRVPVFKFCRSQGRLPWLRRAFADALHAGVWRNPASQFASGWLLLQQWQNPFFVAAPFRVLGLNQNEPVVRQIVEACGVSLPAGNAGSLDEYAALCERHARGVEGGAAYRAFMALWTLCTWRMLEDADLIVDMDLIGLAPQHAAELRARFDAELGVAPDFGRARDLVAETRRLAGRIAGIDGGAIRAAHTSASAFLATQSSAANANLAVRVQEKLALAESLSAQWR